MGGVVLVQTSGAGTRGFVLGTMPRMDHERYQLDGSHAMDRGLRGNPRQTTVGTVGGRRSVGGDNGGSRLFGTSLQVGDTRTKRRRGGFRGSLRHLHRRNGFPVLLGSRVVVVVVIVGMVIGHKQGGLP